MPILFPIAVLNYCMIYIHERYIIAYKSRMPPSLDNTLSTNTIGILQLAPVLMVCNAVWTFSNRQIFEGEVFLKDKRNSPDVTNHTFDCLLQLNQITPLLLILIPILGNLILQVIAPELHDRLGFSLKKVHL